MDEDLHNIDDLFKKAINRHEELPSERVWEKIDKNLDKKSVVFISQKYNKLKWVAAALLIFSGGMAMYTFHTKLKNQELVKLNSVNNRKEIRKDEFKKGSNRNIDEENLSDQFEKERTTKDTEIKNNRNKNYQPANDNEVYT